MKIKIRESNGKGFTLVLPTRLIFSPKLIRFGLRTGRKYAENQIPNIPGESVDALCAEIKRIKNAYGSWTLVDIKSSDGESVEITL